MMKNKMNYVRMFRRINDIDNLEKLVSHLERKLTNEEFYLVVAAADHRRAEMFLNRYLDKVPKNLRRYVRQGPIHSPQDKTVFQ